MPPEKRLITAPTWERQDDEGDEAWRAFKTYRDLGLDRSLDSARQRLGNPSEGYTRVLEGWSSEWSWVRRCVDYERHLDTKRRAAAEAAIVEMAERQARDAMSLQAGLRPFFEALASMSGKTASELVEMSPVALGVLMKELAPAFKAAAEVERKARGVEEVKVSLQGTVVVDGLRQAFMERAARRREGDGMHSVGDGAVPAPEAGSEPGSSSVGSVVAAAVQVPAILSPILDAAEQGSESEEEQHLLPD
ncbi:MAG: hypothetical protein LC623_05440 [Halobacteriales archaeon]|nr:hypothetical protein [Halobacteriales archaeon]